MKTASEPTNRSDFGAQVNELRATFDTGVTKPVSWRLAQLDAMLMMLSENSDEFVAAIRADLGRPVTEAFAADLGHATMAIKHLRAHTARWAKPKKVFPGLFSMPGKASVVAEPLGVALVIAPWNYPVQLLLEPMAAALSAGNAVMAKPSELAPACAELMTRLIPQYLDNSAVAVVNGGVSETTSILEQRFDHIFFTGSTAVGRVVMTAAAKHLTPVTLELGGKSPAVICADANLAVAAKRIAWGKLLNAGQTCVAPDYVLVEASVAEKFVELLRSAIDDFYGDDPQRSGDLARIINQSHFERLASLLAESGGEVVIGGQTDAEQRYVSPTVVQNPSMDSDLMTSEIFGPILALVTVESVQEAIDIINSREKPLALYVFSESDVVAEAVVDATSSGGVCINHTLMHILPENLPFGGVGESGMGSYHGKAGFDTFSHFKSVLAKPTRPDPSLTYPPYSSWKEKLVRRALE